MRLRRHWEGLSMPRPRPPNTPHRTRSPSTLSSVCGLFFATFQAQRRVGPLQFSDRSGDVEIGL